MARRKNKVGDRIFFEYCDGTVGTAIVLEMEPKSYVDDNGRTINYDWLVLWKSGNCSSGTEDYNTLPLSDPRVKALLKELKKQDRAVSKLRRYCLELTIDYNTKTIAAALEQVAKEYGYKEE